MDEMKVQSTCEELACRLVEAVIPWLDCDEIPLLYMAFVTESSMRIIDMTLAIAEQKQCVLPTDLVEDLSNRRLLRLQRERPEPARPIRSQAAVRALRQPRCVSKTLGIPAGR